jgi:phospholipase D1/2
MDSAVRQDITTGSEDARHGASPTRGAPSIFEEGRNCLRSVRARRAALIVDGSDYFEAFMQAAERATRSIIILGWDFDTRTRLTCDPVPSGAPATLGEFLNYLVRRKRRLRIHILNWDYPMVFGTDREFPPPLWSFSWKPRRRVHLRYDNTHPVGGSHHQKIVVIDDAIAFSGGLDLTSRRWDTCEHKASDPRRVSGDAEYPPFHDVMAAVDGKAAKVLGDICRKRWLTATGERLRPPGKVASDPWPGELKADLTDVAVGISRTAPRSEESGTIREVEALFLDMIARARRYIYIENQYFTSHKIADALAARLRGPDPPEIVLVVRLLSHGWLEEHTMEVLRTQNIKKLIAADRSNRFGVYYPFVPGLKEGTCLDIHSKVMVVDDEWLRIGSANICNRSMGFDTECDVTFEARGEARIGHAVRDFRDRLLGEHLGKDTAEIKRTIERAGSLHAAIAALQGDGRTLKRLEELTEWPEAVVNAASVADPEELVSLDRLVKEFSPAVTTDKTGPAWGKLVILALTIAALSAIWRFTPLAELVTGERIIGWAEDFSSRPWAPFIVLLAYTPACLVMFPRPLITLFAVVAFGPWLGFTYALTGILIAAIATYFAGYFLDRATVRRLAGAKLNRVMDVMRQRGLLAVTALRLVPLAPFAVEGIVAGAIRIKLWQFVLGTAIGMLPGTLAATVFGEQLEAALRDPSQVNYWVVAGVALIFVVGTLAVRNWLKRQIGARQRSKRPSAAKAKPA